MTCQNLGVLCLHWSIVVVMATIIVSQIAGADTKPRIIPPEIIDGPNIHEIFHVNDDRIDLPCHATGTPPIVYKWLFNGEEVHPGDRIKISHGRLHLGNPTSDMAGYYQCIATNEAGVAISNITFLQAAVFDELSSRERNTIRSLSIKELNHVLLPCNHITRSIPPAEITWEMSTDGGHHFRTVKIGGQVTKAQDGSLVFHVVRQNNSAIYKCDAKNDVIRSSYGGSKVDLTIETEDASEAERILKQPPVLLYASPDVTVLEGKELRIECLYGAWPDHHVEWTAPSGVTNISQAWIIRSVTTADAGVYSCRAFKSFLSRQLFSHSVNITVRVDAIPSFADHMSNQVVPDSGRDVTFTCQGRGRPSPSVTWYINGVSVEKLEDVLDHSISGDGPTSVLVLRNIRTSATVACNVSNAHGYRLQSAVVTIGDAEVISTSSSHQPVIGTSHMTSAKKHTTTKPYERTTKPLQPYQPSTTSHHSSTTVIVTKDKDDEGKKDNVNDPAAPHFKTNSISSTTTTIIIAAAVAAVVVLVIIIVVVAIIVCRRRRRGNFSLPEQGMPLRAEVRIGHQQTYDSDDSGFDDLKAENERRALQGHQPPS